MALIRYGVVRGGDSVEKPAQKLSISLASHPRCVWPPDHLGAGGPSVDRSRPDLPGVLSVAVDRRHFRSTLPELRFDDHLDSVAAWTARLLVPANLLASTVPREFPRA